MKKLITQKKLGKHYPFTIPEGWLIVQLTNQVMSDGTPIPHIIFQAQTGEQYGLNGYARSSGLYRDYETIWRDNPSNHGQKVATSRVMELASDLMRKGAPQVHQRVFGYETMTF